MTAGSRLWLRTACVLLLCAVALPVSAVAQSGEKPKPRPPLVPPPVFNKPAPETVDDLRAIEAHVQKVVAHVTPAVVGLRIGFGQGSGVVVSGDGTVLTAGHVSGKADANAVVILPDGKQLKGKTRGQNKDIDSGMVRITDPGPHYFLEMGKSADLKKGQWVVAVGHPGGFRPNRTPVVRVGRILQVNAGVIQTDCSLVGGDSGGPLFDMQGRVIGINSRIGGNINDNMHVPIDTFHQTFDRLARGDVWGTGLFQIGQVRPAGGKLVFEKKGTLAKEDPTQPSPKDSTRQSHTKTYVFPMKAGSTYTLDLLSGDKTGVSLDPYLRLESPAGKELAKDDDGGGFPHARIVYKPSKDGDYRVIATSFEPEQTGAFTLKIFEADFKDALVRDRADVLRAIKLPAPAVAKFVDEFKKLKIDLHVHALLIDGRGDPLPNKEVALRWSGGAQTLKSNSEGVVRWPLARDKSKQLTLELPFGVRAMVGLTDANGQPIGLPLKTDPSVEKVKSAGGTVLRTIFSDLKADDPVDALREKCLRHVHEFELRAGRTYTLDLESDDFDAFLRLEDGAATKLAEDDDGAGFLNSRIVFTPTKTGVHRIVVTTCDPGQLGQYRLTIREAEAKK